MNPFSLIQGGWHTSDSLSPMAVAVSDTVRMKGCPLGTGVQMTFRDVRAVDSR
jgi:hypothetical protein